MGGKRPTAGAGAGPDAEAGGGGGGTEWAPQRSEPAWRRGRRHVGGTEPEANSCGGPEREPFRENLTRGGGEGEEGAGAVLERAGPAGGGGGRRAPAAEPLGRGVAAA